MLLRKKLSSRKEPWRKVIIWTNSTRMGLKNQTRHKVKVSQRVYRPRKSNLSQHLRLQLYPFSIPKLVEISQKIQRRASPQKMRKPLAKSDSYMVSNFEISYMKNKF